MLYSNKKGNDFLLALSCTGLVLIASLGMNLKAGARTSLLHVALTDTVFTPQTTDGWGVYASYMHVQNDTIDFEVVLTRINDQNTNWHFQSLSGIIAIPYRPLQEVVINYQEPTRTWQVTIATTGKCYVKLLAGPIPSGNPCLIPIHTFYNK